MKRGTKIIHNRIRCKLCGETIESMSRHDFVPCKCFRDSGGSKGCFVDGGYDYIRWGGNREDFEDLCETRPFTDEEVDEYNRRQLKIKEDFNWEIELMEK